MSERKWWIYTKKGEECWKSGNHSRDKYNSHDEGKKVPTIMYEFCEIWAKNGLVKKQ